MRRPDGHTILHGQMLAAELSTTLDADLARAVMAVAAGNARAAEAELCKRFAPRVRQYGLRHLRDEQGAADLVQRVLVVTIEKLRDRAVREPEQIASFILGTARMVTREMTRGASRVEPLLPEQLSLLESDSPALEPLAAEGLAGCLEQLAERERSVILLTFFQELSATEIARSLSLQEGNVRVIRHRAIQRLRACLGLLEEEIS